MPNFKYLTFYKVRVNFYLNNLWLNVWVSAHNTEVQFFIIWQILHLLLFVYCCRSVVETQGKASEVFLLFSKWQASPYGNIKVVLLFFKAQLLSVIATKRLKNSTLLPLLDIVKPVAVYHNTALKFLVMAAVMNQ